MGAEDIEKLLVQCKSNDIDAKVDALNKLQSQFEEATELADVDSVIAALKSCLRTSNQLLTTATLNVIPSFIRILSPLASQATSRAGSDPPTPGKSGTSPAVQQLRQAILAFLPSGGVVERLGEQREKARDSARLALVEISGAAFQSSPTTVGSRIKDLAKGHETPLALLEKHVKELGLGSKVARVREQTILALVEVRREYRTFPIRPYLPQLVECLEDPDANVRDCARSSVVTLFTGPQVSDAARTDLKNEMAKKGVRKGIVNDVLSKLLSASTTSSMSTPDISEPGEEGSTSSARMAVRKPNPLARSATAPTFIRTATGASASTVMSEEVAVSPSTTEIPDVYIASARDLEHEFAAMVPFFEGKETEHNWLDREKSVIRLRGMVRGDVHERYPDAWFAGLKGGILESTLKALQSLRTTVASQACSLHAELATAMTTNFDPLIEIVLTHLLKMGGFTKKIAAQQSQASVTAILTYTSATPRLVLPLLWSYAQEKTVQVRAYCTAHFKTILEVHAKRPAGKAAIESSGGLDIIEKAVKKGLGDSNPGVREQARIGFWIFNEIWPANAGAVMNTLDSVAKKQLEKANPNPGESAPVVVAATPAPKKSSVAAAIAASRAKAKVLASAPPTLRHAATSGAASKAALPRREGSRSAAAVGRRAASPGAHHRAASPVSPRGSGLASPPTSRSASPPVTRPNNLRSPTASNGSKGKSPALPINSPPPRLPRTQSISPPSSPTPPGSSANHRTASPLIPLGRSTAKPGRSALGQSHAASLFNTASFRDSIIIPPGLDEECITAMQIPLPLDSDEEDEDGLDRSMNLMSFSSAWENMGGTGGGVVSSALSTPGITAAVPDSVIHDNYRAQAQQAESAAAQLLELVHDDDTPALNAPLLVPVSPNQPLVTLSPNPPPATLPPAPPTFLTPGSESAPKLPTFRPPPVTPKSRVSSLAQALKDFRNSPPATSLSQSPSMNRVLFERNDMTGVWWRMRRKAIAKGPAEGEEPSGDTTQLEEGISKLENGSAEVDTLKTLLFICSKNPSSSAPPSPLLGAVNGRRAPSNGMLTPTTPSPLGAGKRAPGGGDIWQDGKALDNLLLALTRFLTKDKSADVLDYGLMVLYEMVFNQSSLLTGHESLVFSFLLEVRYAKKLNVFEATNAIRDVLIEKCDPILGLSTIHRNLEDFLKKPAVEESLAEARTSSYCFSLVALAKFILLLPPEVLEDELPRLKGTLITALSDSTSASIREAAYVTIISAQMKLRDERQLFTILSGLSETQKHLLTYEFEKIKARGPQKSEAEAAGLQKLGGRIRHLDALPAPHA